MFTTGNGTAAIFCWADAQFARSAYRLAPDFLPGLKSIDPRMHRRRLHNFSASGTQLSAGKAASRPSMLTCRMASAMTTTSAWLDNALSSGLRQFEPDLLCYIAGADPYSEDQLGGLKLTIEGLRRRDELVFRVARARGIPVMVDLRVWLRAAGGRYRNHSQQYGNCGEAKSSARAASRHDLNSRL